MKRLNVSEVNEATDYVIANSTRARLFPGMTAKLSRLAIEVGTAHDPAWRDPEICRAEVMRLYRMRYGFSPAILIVLQIIGPIIIQLVLKWLENRRG